MATVTVTASFRFKCRDSAGRIYYTPASVTFITDDSHAYDNYVSDAYQEAITQGIIPENCESYGVTIESVQYLAGEGGGVTPQPVTVYIDVYITCMGETIGPYTQGVEISTGTDIGEIGAILQDRANLFMISFFGGGFGLKSPIEGDESCQATYTVRPPLMYLFSMGD